MRNAFPLHHLQIAFVVVDLGFDFTIKSRVQLRQSEFSLAGLRLRHGFKLVEALTDDIRAVL